MCLFWSDVGDEEEEDQVDSSALPDLEYATKGATAPTFAVLANPEDTWDAVADAIRKALVFLGHNGKVKVMGIDRVRFGCACYHIQIPCL